MKCERCKRPIKKGKRFCKPCAVDIARGYGFDDLLIPEPDQEEVDLIAQYDRRQRINLYAGIGIILLVLAIAIWALSGGA